MENMCLLLTQEEGYGLDFWDMSLKARQVYFI